MYYNLHFSFYKYWICGKVFSKKGAVSVLLVLHTYTHTQRVYTGYTAGGGSAWLDLERGKCTVNRFSLFVDWTAPAGRHAGRRRYTRDSSSFGGTRLVQATPRRLSPAPQRQCATSEH